MNISLNGNGTFSCTGCGWSILWSINDDKVTSSTAGTSEKIEVLDATHGTLLSLLTVKGSLDRNVSNITCHITMGSSASTSKPALLQVQGTCT